MADPETDGRGPGGAIVSAGLPEGISVKAAIGIDEAPAVAITALVEGRPVSIVLPPSQMRAVCFEALKHCDSAERDHLMLGPRG